mgnify:CR=1 FL=1
MKKENNFKDERTILLNHKIQSEAYILIVSLLCISVFIKTYILNLSVSDYIAELVIIIVSLIYTTIRGSAAGYVSIDTSRHGRKLLIAGILGVSLAVSIASGIRNYSLYGDKYSGVLDSSFLAAVAVTFISCVIFITVITGLISSIDKIGQKRLEKQLEKDDE